MADDFEPEGDLPGPPETDLLGAPWCEPKDRRGRRKLRFSRDVYDAVEMFKAAGMSDADIARAVGVSKDAAQRYFRPELENGRARKRAELLDLAMKAARTTGKPAAIKLASQLIDKGDAAIPSDLPAQPVRAERLGKKEEVTRRARDLDGRSEWGRLLN